MSPRLGSTPLRRLLAASLAMVVVLLWIATTSCHGNKLRAEYVPNHPGTPFDFRRPPCEVAALPEVTDDDVVVRYLGVAGIYVAWRGAALLTAPYFTDYSTWRAATGSVDWDLDSIDGGMAGLPDIPIELVLTGHSHFDHLADLPPVVERYAPEAEVWLNASGMNMLENCAGLSGTRRIEIEPLTGIWRRPETADGELLPFRVMAIDSNHAEHFLNVDLGQGEVTEPWDDCLTGHEIRHMLGGKTYTFLIDLLDEAGRTRFRIHFQDAASDAPQGIPPDDILEEGPIDLAIVCMPGAWEVEDYPGHLLRTADVRHVLVTHYEDFAQSRTEPLRFVVLLTNRRANRFMSVVRDEMIDSGRALSGPINPVCGPSGPAWTMPLPGEWVVFGKKGTDLFFGEK